MFNYVFNLTGSYEDRSRPGIFMLGAAGITLLYFLFALILVGNVQLSRGGIAITVLGLGWLVLGLVVRKFKFPTFLTIPALFYAMMILSGLLLPIYPVEYIAQMTTIWLGAIVLAVFAANGLSVNVFILGFIAVYVANMVAILIGYDAYQINIGGHSSDSLANTEVKRVSGLAGQSNLLVALTFTLPFIVFLLRRSLGFVVYAAGVAACVFIMITTASRSTVPFTILFMAAGALFLIKNPLLRLSAVLLIVVGVVAFYVFLQDPYYLSKIENSYAGEFYLTERLIGGIDLEDSSQETRIELATQFWSSFYQSPVVGFGPDQFRVVAGEGFYAHNNWAEIAVNFGSVGLLTYYSLYVIILFGIVKYLPRNYFLLAPLTFLFLADFSFVTYVERPMVLCLLLLLVVVFQTNSQRRRRSRRRVA